MKIRQAEVAPETQPNGGEEPIGFGQKLNRGAFWTFITAVLSRGTMVACAVVNTRILGRAGFGELGIIQSSVMLFATFAGLGLGLTATKYVAELKPKDPARAGRIVALTILAALFSVAAFSGGMVLASNWLALRVYGAARLSDLLACSSVLLLLFTLFGAINGILAGFQAFRAMARVALWGGLASLPITLALVLWYGLTGAVGALIGVAGVNLALAARACGRECRKAGVHVNLSGAWAERQILWSFSLPALLSGAMVGPVTWAADAMLVRQGSAGFSEMGLFRCAMIFFMAVTFLGGVMGRVALPGLSEAHGKGTFAAAADLNLRACWLIALPAVAFLAPSCRFLLATLFGEEFEAAWPMVLVMLGVGLLVAANAPAGNAIAASGKMWLAFALNAAWGLVFLVASWMLIPIFLGLGRATGMLIAYFSHTVLVMSYLVFCQRTLNVRTLLMFLFQGLVVLAVSYVCASHSSSGWPLICGVSLAAGMAALAIATTTRRRERESLIEQVLIVLRLERPTA